MTRLGSSIQHEGKLQSIYYFDIDIRFEGICLAITCNGLPHLNPEIRRMHMIIITS